MSSRPIERIELPHKKYQGLQTIGHKIGQGDRTFDFEIQPNELLVVRFHDQDKLRTVGGIVSKVADEKILIGDLMWEQNEPSVEECCAPLLCSIVSIVQGNRYMGSVDDRKSVVQFFKELTKDITCFHALPMFRLEPMGPPVAKRPKLHDAIVFKASHKNNGIFLLSNFYGGAEFDYMIPKFDVPTNKRIVAMFRRWKAGDYGEGEDFHSIRHKLARCRVGCDGTLERKGGKSGDDWTETQKKSYVASYCGVTYEGNGILMKLAASVWKDDHRRHVLERLAGMEPGTMIPPLNLYHWMPDEDPSLVDQRASLLSSFGVCQIDNPVDAVEELRRQSMMRALRSKFKDGSVFKEFLLGTETKDLLESGNDPIFGSGTYLDKATGERRECGNLLGELLMELRAEFKEL